MHESELQLELQLGVIHYVPVRAPAALDANSWRRGRSRSLGRSLSGGSLPEAFPAARVAVLLCCTAFGLVVKRSAPNHESRA
jgi:hypothetical protein